RAGGRRRCLGGRGGRRRGRLRLGGGRRAVARGRGRAGGPHLRQRGRPVPLRHGGGGLRRGRRVEGGAGREVGEELAPALADGLGVLEVLRVEVLDVPGVEAEGVLLDAVLAHGGGAVLEGGAKVTPAREHRFGRIAEFGSRKADWRSLQPRSPNRSRQSQPCARYHAMVSRIPSSTPISGA